MLPQTVWKQPLTFAIITAAFLGLFFYTFYTSGNRNEYSTIYIFNSLMTSQLHHFKRHKSLFHRVKDERWTTLLKKTDFRFDYNSGVSWSIFILSELMETEINTLQRSQQKFTSP